MSMKSGVSRLFTMAMLTVCSAMIIGCSDNSPDNTNSQKPDATTPSAVSTQTTDVMPPYKMAQSAISETDATEMAAEIMQKKAEALANLFSKQVIDFCKIPKAERIKAPSKLFTAEFLNAVAEADESYYREGSATKDVLREITPAQIGNATKVQGMKANMLIRLSFATFSSIPPDRFSSQQVDLLIMDDFVYRTRVRGYRSKITPNFVSKMGVEAKNDRFVQSALFQFASPQAFAALNGKYITAQALNLMVEFARPDTQKQLKGDYTIDMDNGTVSDPKGNAVQLSSFTKFKNIQDLRTKLTMPQIWEMDKEELEKLQTLTLLCMADKQREDILSRQGYLPKPLAPSSANANVPSVR